MRKPCWHRHVSGPYEPPTQMVLTVCGHRVLQRNLDRSVQSMLVRAGPGRGLVRNNADSQLVRSPMEPSWLTYPLRAGQIRAAGEAVINFLAVLRCAFAVILAVTSSVMHWLFESGSFYSVRKSAYVATRRLLPNGRDGPPWSICRRDLRLPDQPCRQTKARQSRCCRWATACMPCDHPALISASLSSAPREFAATSSIIPHRRRRGSHQQCKLYLFGRNRAHLKVHLR